MSSKLVGLSGSDWLVTGEDSSFDVLPPQSGVKGGGVPRYGRSIVSEYVVIIGGVGNGDAFR